MDLGPPGREAGGSLLASLLQALEDNRSGAIFAFAAVRALDTGSVALERALPALVRAGGARTGMRALAAWSDARAQSFGLLDAAYEAADAAVRAMRPSFRTVELSAASRTCHSLSKFHSLSAAHTLSSG